MASPSFPLFLVTAMVLVLLTSPVHSQNCTSQTFPQRNTTYTSCSNLPSLRASIHWTYNPTSRPRPTLSIAFTAPPARPNGWIAWALNPTGTGMVGAQSLIAFRDTNGSMVVRTYNITSYSSITESTISYNVLNRSAEYSNGVMRIFATLEVPSSLNGQVNQVWQVGGSVRNEVPERHEFAAENLSSRNTLQLAGETTPGNRTGAAVPPMGGSGGGGAVPPTVRQSGGDTGGCGMGLGNGLGLYGVLVLLGFWISLY